jgi:nucleoid-associated protein YgaU
LQQLQAEHDAAYDKLASLETENAKLGDQLAANPTPTPTQPPAPTTAPVATAVKPTTPVKPATPTKHTVGKGETLLSIARKYYGGSKTWEVIWEANKEQLIKSDPRNAENPGQYVPLGETLLIP